MAQDASIPVPVPESKAVFTVKLPCRLSGQVRRKARKGGVAISDWVAAALQEALETDSSHG
jgi:predicted HicB family RNase H-like nuclease